VEFLKLGPDASPLPSRVVRVLRGKSAAANAAKAAGTEARRGVRSDAAHPRRRVSWKGYAGGRK
jgi:hypothetical protein